jgi:hypothetical protein
MKAQLNIRISESGRETLTMLAEAKHMTQAAVIEEALKLYARGGAGRAEPTTREPDRKVEPVSVKTPAPIAGPEGETPAAKLARLRGLQTAVLAGEHPSERGETCPDSSSDHPLDTLFRPRRFSDWDIGRRNAWLKRNYPGTFELEAQDQDAVTEWLNSLPEEPAE